MADSKRWPDNKSFTVNDYRLSWNGDNWQAVKNGVIVHRHATRTGIKEWAQRN